MQHPVEHWRKPSEVIESGHMPLAVKTASYNKLIQSGFQHSLRLFQECSVMSSSLLSSPELSIPLTSMFQKCWIYNCYLNPQCTLSSMSLHFSFSLELSSHYLFPRQLLWLSPLIPRNLSLFLQLHPTLAGSPHVCSHSTLRFSYLSFQLPFALLSPPLDSKLLDDNVHP